MPVSGTFYWSGHVGYDNIDDVDGDKVISDCILALDIAYFNFIFNVFTFVGEKNIQYYINIYTFIKAFQYFLTRFFLPFIF